MLAVTAAATCAVGLTVAPAAAESRGGGSPSPVRVVASGLNGPFQIADGGRYLYVAENGPRQITRIDRWTGAKSVAVTGFGDAQPQGVTRMGRWLVIVTGGGQDTPLPSTAASVFVARDGGTPRKITDLLAYEKANNPDGQVQQTGPDADSLSNPYYVVPDPVHRDSVIVADAGANDLLRVRLRDGAVTRAKALPLVRTGSLCSGNTGNNTADGTGCDPVPTGIVAGPRNTLYVSGLSAEAPGQGRIYVLDARTWRILRVISGLDAPTGVALDRRGNVYASEVTYGAPAGEPGPDFDPSTVGRIVRIDRCGHQTFAAVTMPSGLLWSHGRLYASAWAIAGFVGIQDAGQVVTVHRSAFVPAS
ncbi:hypothetical protein FHX74_002259 [Friedmanniella endophytica]|uniref:NHL repeat-containing protein n=1 Tax=Microlunatus kandeliicorticis TaxID=1759536 RepID=A0A7W3P678_9ACTN|nr:ScyD/ScyE family protein [Microlunatus kandeliicorticis]MBA8794640.1 hypothetical protein [Microlunatus kandeliicorticis]